MANHTINKLSKNTVEIILDIPKADIATAYTKTFDILHKNFETTGFRKGKVPKDIAEKEISKDDVYSKMLNTILPDLYEEVVKSEGLNPVVSPKMEILEAKEGEDWKIKITVAEKPVIDLKDYKAYLKSAKSELKKDEIWVPGKEPQEKDAVEDVKEKKQKAISSALDALLNNAECEISDMIIESEVERRLTGLLDEIQKIGLTVDSYLKSKGLTMDQMRARVTKEIEDTYKLEFILMELADKESISVDNKELEAMFEAVKDEKEREAIKQNAYMYASVMRKQKTLDFIASI